MPSPMFHYFLRDRSCTKLLTLMTHPLISHKSSPSSFHSFRYLLLNTNHQAIESSFRSGTVPEYERRFLSEFQYCWNAMLLPIHSNHVRDEANTTLLYQGGNFKVHYTCRIYESILCSQISEQLRKMVMVI